MASQAATTVDPGRQALADVEQARSLLIAAARLAPIKRGSASVTISGPSEALEQRVTSLCDRIAGQITLRYPRARRSQSDRVLP